ncbi:MAG: DoxX family protein [Pseudomonadota bacterium]
MMNGVMFNAFDFVARILMGGFFLSAGINKLQNYPQISDWMGSHDVSGNLLPCVIALEIIAPLFMIVGLYVRLSALLLAGFSILTALLFHYDFSDQLQSIMFTKNMAISGGLLCVVAHGAGSWRLRND